ncbi:MAG TPA: HPF/RaiA family ribosome-associated protein [Stellaceae bacterium]|nr:HPF/RaiA family ribosome-associated protein [Stellaceae bacterium]
MQSPLEIAFHNLPSSEWVEQEIRERVAKLEKRYPRLVGCRVSVEALHHQHRTGNIYEVHIDLKLPGGEVAVSREPHHARDKYAHPDLKRSLRDAFAAAERRLDDFKEQQAGEIKTHAVPFQGQIAEIDLAGEHGFILTAEGSQLYFHRNSVMNADFAKLKRGDAVHYVATDGDTGPTAAKVWLGPDYHLD